MNTIVTRFTRESTRSSLLGWVATGAALAIAAVGIVVTSFNPMWIAGSLGISAAAASQIVAAIKAGKKAYTVIAAVAGAGVASALTATIVWIVFNWAVEPAVA